MTKISNQYSLTNILTADLANSRLGINNVSPTVALDVTGAGKFSSTLQSNGGFIQPNQTEIFASAGASNRAYAFSVGNVAAGDFTISQGSTATGGTYTTRLTINPSGNVGIGTSSPSAAGGAFTGLDIRGSSGGSLIMGSTSTAYAFMYGENTGFYIQTPSGIPLNFLTSTTERMRITSGGTVCMNMSTALGTETLNIAGTVGGSANYGIFLSLNSSVLTAYAMRFYNAYAGTVVGSITMTASATAYNTGSDYRLKEDLKEIKGLDKVSAIKVYDFKWKGEESRMDGVLAHELSEVLPYAVHGVKDGKDMQAVDYSKIVPILIKGMQEQQSQIQELSAKVSLLENK
jgi:hypothetical protein